MSFLPLQEFVLCADDFGLTNGISEGILDLASKRRLSAASCMMNQPATRRNAMALKSHAAYLDIGVHLVLTDLQPLSPDLGRCPSIGSLTRRALTGGLPESDIRIELARQLEAFVDIFGRNPDFVDGHHHVHQLPGIRDIVLDLINELFSAHKPYIRSCRERPSVILRRGIDPLKAASLGFLGSALRQHAKARGIPVNDGFSGIYDFSGKVPYGVLFDRFTDGLRPGALIVCHPGMVDEELRILDSLTDQREVERAYFLSDDFPALLERKSLRLGRFSTTFQ